MNGPKHKCKNLVKWFQLALFFYVLVLSKYVYAEIQCRTDLNVKALIASVIAHDPEIKKARLELDAIAARKVSSGVWLPSHPVVTFAAAYRQNETLHGYNLYGTLSQEIAIAGQRGARLLEMDAQAQVQLKKLYVLEQEITAQFLQAYADYLSALEESVFLHDLDELGTQLNVYLSGRLEEQLISEIDASLIQVDVIGIKRSNLQNQKRLKLTKSVFNILCGCQLDLEPTREDAIKWPDPKETSLKELLSRALLIRGETEVAQAEIKVSTQRIETLKRERIPHVTLSAMLQRDGFNELVMGGQISFPLFLPSPLSPSRDGEIQEAKVRQSQAAINLQTIQKQIRLEVSRAYEEFVSKKQEAELITPDKRQKLKNHLKNIHKNLGVSSLPIRDALFTQRALIEQLRADIRARFDYQLAIIELYRASGLDLKGVLP